MLAKASSIDDLKNASAETLASMDDEKLAIYLADIINLEPKPLPRPLGVEEKVTKVKKVKTPKEKESSTDEDNCPIKSTSKSAKDRVKLASLLAEIEGELNQ